MGLSFSARVVWGGGEGGKMELWDFTGTWSLRRRIAPDAGPAGAFRGRATLAPDGAGLRYREEGTLRLAGRGSFAATRTHLWRPVRGGVSVLFEDGRPFHRIDLRAPRPEAVHPCGADIYAVRYDLERWPEWTARWRVDGPRKGYCMTSRYAPLAGAGAIGHPDADA